MHEITTTGSRASRVALLLLTLLVTACGGSSGDDDPPLGSDPFPLAVGNSWEFQHNDQGRVSAMTAKVTGTTVINGEAAYMVAAFDNPVTTRYLRRTDTEVIRLPDPASALEQQVGPVVMLKLPLRAGDRWVAVDKTVPGVTDFDGDGLTDPVEYFTEVSVDRVESITTGAGRFSEAHVVAEAGRYAIHFTSGDGPLVYGHTQTTQWIVAGVGVVQRQTSITPPDGPFMRQTFDSLEGFDVAPN